MKPLIRPLAFEVMHRDPAGRPQSVRVFSRETADRLYAEQLADGLKPTLYLGGLAICGDETNTSQTKAEPKAKPLPRRSPRCRCAPDLSTGLCKPCIQDLLTA